MHEDGLSLHTPGAAIRSLYVCLFLTDAILILVTTLYDLKYHFTLNSLQLEMNLELEGNAAVWYSSMLLLLVSGGAYYISTITFEYRHGRWFSYLWKLAALSFLYISVDETAQLHEKAGVWVTKHAGQVPDLTQGSHPVFAWLLVALPVAIVFIVCMVMLARWCLQLNARSLSLILSATICWVCVLCSEFIQAQLVRLSLGRGLEGCIEEGLEIIGSTLFFVAFIELLRAHASRRAAVSAPDPVETRCGGSHLSMSGVISSEVSK